MFRWLVDAQQFRFFDKQFDDAVVAVWEGVSALIAFERQKEAAYV